MNADNNLELQTNIDFSTYNVFFIGEFHGVYGISEIKLALIKYLNKKYGITDVFMEMSYSAAWLYNQYLSTGDTAYLVNPVLLYNTKKSYREFLTELYEYNKGLQEKIKIRGIDFERIEFLKVLKLLMPAGKEKPKEIYPLLTYFDTVTVPKSARLHSPEFVRQIKLYEAIRDSIKLKENFYKEYFGKNFELVETIMFNEDTYLKFTKRNKAMYKNIIKQVKSDGIKKFIVINGMNHGRKNRDLKGWWKTVCYRLAHNPDFKHKLVDFAMVCKNCYDYQVEPEYQYADFRGPYSYGTDSLISNDIYKKYYANSCIYTLISTNIIDNAKVKKFSDYIILMKDQPKF